MSALLQDLLFGLRMLRKSPGFTAVAVLTLALGIGANTAIFSVMDAMLLRELPVRSPQELVEFVRAQPDGAMMSNLPYAVFEHLQKNMSVLSGVFALTADTRVLRAGNDSERVLVHEVSGSFFSTLGVTPLLGRGLEPSDSRLGGTNEVAVLSYSFWSRRFGRDPSALGTTVRVDDVYYTIVGVMGPSFFGVDPSQLPAMWVPLPSDPNQGEVWVLGRLKRGISIPKAHAELEPLFHQALESMRGEIAKWPAHDQEAFLAQKLVINHAATGTSGLRWEYWDYSSTLKILLGMAALILLISCANLAAVLVVRSVARTREIGIRMAIGATRGRITRQLLTENLLWALLGGMGGLLLALWGHQLILKFLLGNAQETPLNFHLDQRVLSFSVIVSLLTGVLSGMLPALAAVRRDVVPAIQQASLPGGTRLPFARNLLALQVAVSLTLLVGAGLFVRTLRNLAAANLGLTRQDLILMTIDPGPAKSIPEQQAFWNQLTQRVAALPGVRSVSVAGDAVFGRGGWNETVWMRQADGSEHDAQVAFNVVGPGFLETVGIPLLAGRRFDGQDEENSPRVAVVNRAFARKFLNQENPVGERFGDRGPNSSSQIEIVGVIGDARYRDIREPPPPMFYLPLSQNFVKRPYELHVRTALHAPAEIAAIRREIQSSDSDASVYNVRTIAQVVDDLLEHDRMFAVLASAFGLVALVLTSIGIYASVAHQVAHRTAEIGLRMALGAQRRDILWMTFRGVLNVVLIGMALGIPAAWATSRLISSRLYGLTAHDTTTTVGAAFLILSVAGLAALLPARRAMRVDPMVALRYE